MIFIYKRRGNERTFNNYDTYLSLKIYNLEYNKLYILILECNLFEK